jgi:autotransporter-associated beta strand protein
VRQSEAAIFILVLASSLTLAHAQSDGYWTNPGGGSWANANNWQDQTIASGTDNSAYFGFSGLPVNANATFTLDGAQTIGFLYFFSTNNWTFNPGSGGPLTLSIDLNDEPQVVISSAQQQITFNIVVAGTNGLELLGTQAGTAGTLVLNAANTYTGGTIVDAGTLLVNGSLADTGLLSVSNSATLGGTGVISGPVIIDTGGILSPGALTISNALTLQTGSKTWIEVNASTLAHDSVNHLTSVNYAGTLIVSNLAGTPALGQSFPIFNAAGSSGDFAGIAPQLTGAVRWKFIPASGTLSVVSTNSQPRFAAITPAGTNLTLTLTNGVPGGTNYLLATTNLQTAFTNWTRLATNVFYAGGGLILTTPISPSNPRCFYQLLAP